MCAELAEKHVVRPSLPPLAWVAAAIWAGVEAAEAVAWHARTVGSSRAAMLTVAVVVCVLVGSGVRLYLTRRGVAALVVLGVVCGACVGGLYWWRWEVSAAACEERPAGRWRFEVLDDAQEGPFGARSRVRVLDGGATSGCWLKVGWPKGEAAPEAGQEVVVLGKAKPAPRDDIGRRSHRSGVHATMSARDVRVVGWARSARGAVGPLRRWATGAISREVPGPGGDLLSGVVLGDRRRMVGTVAETDFRTTGLTHLVAVSGSHLVVVAALAGWVCSLTRAGPWSRRLTVAAVVGAYVVLSGLQASALRAWVMAVAAVGAWGGGRRADSGSVLAVAVCALLVATPTCAFDLGFRLSVAAVAGLVLFARLGSAWFATLLPRRMERLAEPLALTQAAQATTLPLTVSAFGMLSMVAPVANILVAPLVESLLLAGLGALGVTAISPPAGAVALRAAGALGAFAADVAGRLADLPYAAVPVGGGVGALTLATALVCASVWIAWPAPSRRVAMILATVAALVVSCVALGPMQTGSGLTVLDVGQGDAILVRDSGHSVLVDTGPSESALRPALGRMGVRRLDAVVLTHMHDDHTGGLSAMMGLVGVGAVYVPAGTLTRPAARQRADDDPSRTAEKVVVASRRLTGTVRELRSGDVLQVGRARLRVLWPDAPKPDTATNEASVVLDARFDGLSALLTGDAESDVLDVLVGRGALEGVDVVKVGHHGSAGALSRGDLAVLRPRVALISVGRGNRFGHPHASTLSELAAYGVRVVRTDEAGDILVEPSGGRFVVRRARAVCETDSANPLTQSRSRWQPSTRN